MRLSDLTRSLTGLLAGLSIAFAAVVVATSVSIVSALHDERTTRVLGISQTRYSGGTDGGFQLGVSPGGGTTALLVAGLVCGGVVPLLVRVVRQRRSGTGGLGTGPA